jgi:3-phenylpropionate/trans-cinnamate dioxygenase ferredoxin reductase subunit
VVVGVGVAPVTDWLESSGLSLRDGVVCDERCEAAPGIVAAGDVARWHHRGYGTDMRVEHWTNASEQAAAAAATLLRGDQAAPYEPIPYFWSDQHGTKIQFVGTGGPDVAVAEGGIDDDRFVATYSRDGKLVGVLLWNRAARLPYWMDQLSSFS